MRCLWPDPVDDVDAFELVAAELRRPPGDRPWVLVNMIASLDGAITVEGRSGGLGAPADKAMFAALRGIGDVILVGAGTVRAEDYGPARPSAATRAARAARGQAEVPRIAVVTRSLELDPDSRFFTEAVVPPLVITCESSPAKRRRALEAHAEVVVAGVATVDLAVALRRLGALGAGVVTCEGGPRLNGELIAADLVDEWDLSIAALLVGEDSDRAAVGPRPPVPLPMQLDRLVEGDGLLLGRWLRTR